MKKFVFIFCVSVFINCTNQTDIADCFPGVSMYESIDLQNPEFIDLQVPTGSATTNLRTRNILIIRRNTTYQAFDLECPEKDCTSSMDFDGLKMTCTCSQKKYNSLNGSPDDGKGCFALEYNVSQISSSFLQISH
jgi:nitrite reductase/ring-hydroxylating ferredoxin subunit